MSFVRNFEDNRSFIDADGIGPVPQSFPSGRATAKVTTTFSIVADAFVRNLRSNRLSTDEDSPNAFAPAVLGGLEGAADATSGDKVIGWNNTNGGLEIAL